MALIDIFVSAIVAGTMIALLVGLRRSSSQLGQSRSQTTRKVLGSFLSTCAGCIAGSLTAFVLIDGWREPGVFLLCVIITGAVLLPVWLLLVLPVYFFVPRRSVFWRPLVATSVGAYGGPLVMAILFWRDWSPFWPLFPAAVVVGAVTCYYAAATADHFRGVERGSRLNI